MTTRTALRCFIRAAIAGAGIAALPAHAVTVGTTDVTFGGYIKLDAMVTQTDGGQIATGIGREFYVPGLTPTGASDESANVDMHARQTRLFTKTSTTLDNGKTIKGYVEIDFMSTAGGDERITNGYSPELRHAVMTYENWTLGQTWSTYMDTAVLPDSLDFIGNTDGAVFVRQGLIRYSKGAFQFAVENPQTTVTPFAGGARITTDDNGVPDLVARFNHSAAWGSLTLAALARELAYEAGTINDSALGYGVGVSAKINLSGKDDLRLTVNHGEGLGRYVALNASNDAVVSASGDLEAIGVTALAAAYKHHWSEKWRSSLILSQLTVDNDVALTGTAVTKQTESVAVNLINQVADKFLVGVELRHANHELESGRDGDFNRLQFSARYDF
jgi:hypothetical protein